MRRRQGDRRRPRCLAKDAQAVATREPARRACSLPTVGIRAARGRGDRRAVSGLPLHLVISDRSRKAISKDDLSHLSAIAHADREQMFAKNPRWALYRNRLLCVALCQGAALHYIDGKNGIKDFDVWTFFAANPKRPYPDPALYRRNRHVDFASPKFGKSDDPRYADFVGRTSIS